MAMLNIKIFASVDCIDMPEDRGQQLGFLLAVSNLQILKPESYKFFICLVISKILDRKPK
jgi:hypothetical protein